MKFKRSMLLPVCFLSGFMCVSAQQYHPPAGVAGTHAMHKDSSAFINWATGCTVQRGYQDISNPALGLASTGAASMATGKAQMNGVVSLGDGGTAVCTFEKPVRNGPGYDFAVFENGFEINATEIFLELAFVEVSSDGINFFRFPTHSLVDTQTQTDGFGPTDARKINNLAGKYVGGYGTPFDLEELAGQEGLNVNRITHIKIVDAVGTIDPLYATRDSYNNIVNEPWPTPFPQGGFDLDAIGVIYQSDIVGLKNTPDILSFQIYPNPAEWGSTICIDAPFDILSVQCVDYTGKTVLTAYSGCFSSVGLSPGLYSVCVIGENHRVVKKILIR